MLNCLGMLLSSTDMYYLYLFLKSEKQKVIFCIIQMYNVLFCISSILVYFLGGVNAAILLFIFYFSYLCYCIKTAIPLE